MRALCLSLLFLVLPATAAELPIFDAHVHYSHDAWDNLPPKAAIEILRKAGVKRALVSSSGDDGQQRLVAVQRVDARQAARDLRGQLLGSDLHGTMA